MANGDVVPIKPELEHPERVVKNFLLGQATIEVHVPRIDQDGKGLGVQPLFLELADLPAGPLKDQLKQLVRRLLERDGWIAETP